MGNITSIHKYQKKEVNQDTTPDFIIKKLQNLLVLHVENSYQNFAKDGEQMEIKEVLEILDSSDFCFDSHIQQVDETYELTQSWKNILIELFIKYEIIQALENKYHEKFDFWELNDLLTQINPFLSEKIEIKQEYSWVDLVKLEKQFWKDEYEEYEILEYRIWEYLENYLEYSNEFKMNKSEIQILLHAFKYADYEEISIWLNQPWDSLSDLFKQIQNQSIWNLRKTLNIISVALNQKGPINKNTFSQLKDKILEWISKILQK